MSMTDTWPAFCFCGGPRRPPLRRRHVQPDVREVPQPPRVVVPDVVPDGRGEVGEAAELPLVAVEHLVLHRPEEALHDAVVEAVALSRHRLPDSHPAQRRHVGGVAVLPPLVGVEDRPPEAAVRGEGPAEHPHLLCEVRREGEVVGDDLPGEHVLDGREVALRPAGEGELADVGRPLLVRPRAAEVGQPPDPAPRVRTLTQQEVRRLPSLAADVGVVPDAPPDPRQAHLPHQALHPLVVDGQAPPAQLGGDPPHAVPGPVLLEDVRNEPGGLGVPRVRVPASGLEEIGRLGQAGGLEEILQPRRRDLSEDLPHRFGPEPWRRSSASAKAFNFFK